MNNSISLHLKAINATISFQKLSNKEWYDLHQSFAPIFEDWDFLMMLDFHHYKKSDFNLAKMYTALFTLFGGHNNYDNYKCTFSYKFKLTIERKGKTYDYGLRVFDMKGNMPYFTYSRKPKKGENVNAYQRPIDSQFSKEDMRFCTLGFIRFLENFLEGYQPFFNQSFYRVNRAGYLIYGFEDDAFFNHFYDYNTEEHEEKFQTAIEEYRNKKHLQTDMSKAFWRDDDVK